MDVTETTVVRRCLNPIWNATFSFEIQHGEVYQNGQSAMLHITIEDWDALSNNDVLGHIVVPVSSLQSKSRLHSWFPLSSTTGPSNACSYGRTSLCGEVELTARWIHNPILSRLSLSESGSDATPNELRITLVRARGLDQPGHLPDTTIIPDDPFVRLRFGTKVWFTERFRTLCPVWNEACAVPFHACDISSGVLEVAVAPKLDYGAELKLQSLAARRSSRNVQPLQQWLSLTRRPDRARLGRGVDACVEIKLQAPHAALSPELHLLDGVTQSLTDFHTGGWRPCSCQCC